MSLDQILLLEVLTATVKRLKDHRGVVLAINLHEYDGEGEELVAKDQELPGFLGNLSSSGDARVVVDRLGDGLDAAGYVAECLLKSLFFRPSRHLRLGASGLRLNLRLQIRIRSLGLQYESRLPFRMDPLDERLDS